MNAEDSRFDSVLCPEFCVLGLPSKTGNWKQETDSPRGPNFALVYSFQSRVLLAGKMGDLKFEEFQAEPNFALVYSFQSRVLLAGKMGGSESSREISQLPNYFKNWLMFCIL